MATAALGGAPPSPPRTRQPGRVRSQSSLWMFQQLPPPSSSCPKVYPNLGPLPHHPAALTSELLCLQTQALTDTRGYVTRWAQPQTLTAPNPPQGFSIPQPVPLVGHQPLDFRSAKAGTSQALLQQEGRRSGESSPTAFDPASHSQTVPSSISRWKGQMGTPSPTEVQLPGPLMPPHKSPCLMGNICHLWSMLSPSLQGKGMSMAYLNLNSRILVLCCHKVLQEHGRPKQATCIWTTRWRSLQCSVVA